MADDCVVQGGEQEKPREEQKSAEEGRHAAQGLPVLDIEPRGIAVILG